jgi:hypothetical protein
VVAALPRLPLRRRRTRLIDGSACGWALPPADRLGDNNESKEDEVKKVIAGALVACTVLGLAATAEAHTLTRKEAATAAWLKADDWAEGKEWKYGSINDVTVTRSDCWDRRSRHVIMCEAEIEFQVEGHYCDYCSDGWTDEWKHHCYLDIKVRLGGWDTRERVISSDCL